MRVRYGAAASNERTEPEMTNETNLPYRTHDEHVHLVPKKYRNFASGVRVADDLGTVVGTIVSPVKLRSNHRWMITIEGASSKSYFSRYYSENAAQLVRNIERGGVTLLPPLPRGVAS